MKVDGEEVLTTVVEELVAEEDAEEQVVANSQEETENNITLTPMRQFLGRFKIVFGFLQVNAALSLTFDTPWPANFENFINLCNYDV